MWRIKSHKSVLFSDTFIRFSLNYRTPATDRRRSSARESYVMTLKMELGNTMKRNMGTYLLTAGTIGMMASSVFAQDESTPAAVANQLPGLFWIAPIGAIAALVMAFVFYKGFMATSEGDANMAKIAQAVREGAYAYLARQAKVVYAVVAVLAIILLIMGQTGLQENMTWLGVIVASVLSGFCGFLGMKTATNASARTANAAKNSLNDGLKVAFRAGAVMGLCVTGFALADVSAWFIILSKVKGLETAAIFQASQL